MTLFNKQTREETKYDKVEIYLTGENKYIDRVVDAIVKAVRDKRFKGRVDQIIKGDSIEIGEVRKTGNIVVMDIIKM